MSSRLEVRKVLTPEQRDKMLLSGQGRDGRGDRDGFRKGGRQGARGGDCDNIGKGQRGNGSGRGNW
jgi:Spy/CpxP family protein refolding chaperone